MKLLSELSSEEQAAWQEIMLDYAYDFSDWNRARTHLLGLLHAEHKHATETQLLSYLSCCAEAVSGSYPLPNLSLSVEEFYKKFGMDSATPEEK